MTCPHFPFPIRQDGIPGTAPLAECAAKAALRDVGNHVRVPATEGMLSASENHFSLRRHLLPLEHVEKRTLHGPVPVKKNETTRCVRGASHYPFNSFFSSLKNRQSVPSAMIFAGFDLIIPASCRRKA